MSRRTGRNNNYTSGMSPSGFFRAKVVAVSGEYVSVKVSRLGLNNIYENVPFTGFSPAVGDRVWVSFVEGRASHLLAFVGAGDTSTDITEIVAGTNLNGGGTGGSITVNLDDDITLSSVTADGFYGDLYGAIHILVKNVSGGSLTKGTPVYATGAVGASGAVEVEASLAGTGSTMPAMGLLDQDLDHNGQGDVVVSGVLQNIDTDTPGYSVGDELFVAASGGLTTTRPTGSSELVQKIGKVIRVQQNTGEILVQGAGRTNDVPNSISITGDMTVGGDATVTGDLTVNGTTVTLNTETLTVEDNIIVLNSNVSGAPSLDAGIEIERGSSSNVSFLWDESNDRWTIGSESLVAGTFIGALTGNVTGAVAATTLTASGDANFDSGTLFVDVSANRVGIGKTDPSYKLDLDAGVDGNILRLKGANDTLNITVSDGDYSILNSQQSNGLVIYDDSGGVEVWYNGASYMDFDSGGIVARTTLNMNSNSITASGGITGLDLSNGISGSNFNITGVNQLEINDPGEGIVWKGGASGDISLYVSDDANDDTLITNGNIYVNKSQAWLTLDSPSTGGNTTNQSAGISIGESAGGPGATGTAAIHMTYTGDGYGYIGMGSLSGNGYPSNRAMRLYYTNDDVYFYGGTTTVGGANAYSFSGNSNVAGTGNAIYSPSGIYSTGTNWLYGPIITNNNYIAAGSGAITTSGALNADGNIFIRNGSPTIYLRDTNHRSAMLHQNSNVFYVLRGSGNDSTTWQTTQGEWPLIVRVDNNEVVAGGQVRVPNMDGTGSYNTCRYNTSNGHIMHFTSLAEHKTDIVEINGVLGSLNERSLLHDLRPILFHENQETATTRGEYIPGFIAEEVHEVAPELTFYDRNGELISYSPEALVPHLVAEIQRLNGMVEELYRSAHPDWTPPQPRPSGRGDDEKAVFDAGAAYTVANPVVIPPPNVPIEPEEPTE